MPNNCGRATPFFTGRNHNFVQALFQAYGLGKIPANIQVDLLTVDSHCDFRLGGAGDVNRLVLNGNILRGRG